MYKYFFASMIALVTTTANAEEFCVMPVKGGEARLPVEFEQPYRIATSPRAVPGFDGLIVEAFNRQELYEFDGSNLILIENDFPHVWGYAFEHGIHLGPGGEAYGFGSQPQMIFHFKPNASKWEPIDGTLGYQRAFFDQGSGDVFWQPDSSEEVKRISADGATETVDLPVFTVDQKIPVVDQTISVRTISEINGSLALTGGSTWYVSSSLWFRPRGKGWSRVTVNLPEGQRLLDTFHDAEVQVSNGLVRIFPSNNAFEPLIFRFSARGLEFAGSLPAGEWRYHQPSKNWIGWSKKWVQSIKKHGSAFDIDEPESIPPSFFVLGPYETGAHAIPDLASWAEDNGQSIFYHPEPIVLINAAPALLRSDRGIIVFDGVHAQDKEALRYETIGYHPDIMALGELNIIQSEKGVFVLQDDLSVRRINSFPAETPWTFHVSIDYVEAWGTYIIVDRRSGEAYFSKDMQHFIKIESQESITGVAGILPEPASVLAVGEDKLLAITQECEP